MNWNKIIEKEGKKPYFIKLNKFLNEEDKIKTIMPVKANRLSCFSLCSYEDVKVVIIGQDPYHNHNQAHGLSFSVLQGKQPPSLKNIFKELVSDMCINYPTSGNLAPWAKQGVLLLNTVFTVELHKPLSHQNKGWEQFSLEIVKNINNKEQPCVFILWGGHAKKYQNFIDETRHLVLTSVHPSPLSSYRGFFGSRPFSKANTFLKKSQIKPIDWELK